MMSTTRTGRFQLVRTGLAGLAAALLLTTTEPAPGISTKRPVVPDLGTVGLPPMTASHGPSKVFGGKVQVFVELAGEPAAVTYAESLRQSGVTSQSSHAEIDAAKARAASVARTQIDANRAEHAALAARLAAPDIGATEIYRVDKVLNGIAVIVDASRFEALARLPGVKSVRYLVPKEPASTPNQNITYINAPPAWNNTIPGVNLGKNLTGTGIRVADIDTGLDYLHSNFGGTGQLATYQAASAASAGFTTLGGGYFPTAKVVGGYDLAGDNYDANGTYGSATPVPDPNPMDCGGHGSHTAGTIAGFGVNAGGTTYTGTYGPSTPFSSMLIPPGVAPNATLYAYRVFGCNGSTNLVAAAIDMAMDPNGDHNLADHVDVINLSLGSSYGGPDDDPDSIAANNAALAGVALAISAGNSGDAYFISGSPGTASRALSVAASADGGQSAGGVKVNAPSAIAGNSYVAFTAAFGPNTSSSGLTGNVVRATDAANGSGPTIYDCCTALTNAAAVSGNIALIDRGTCTFKLKVLNAQNAGATGVIIANVSSSSAPGTMGDDSTIVTPITIPSVLVQYQPDGQDLRNNVSGENVTIYSVVGAADTIASFSSRGPRNGEPVKLKPEVTAPGVNVVSTQTGVVCKTSGPSCFYVDPSGFYAGNQMAIASGTSMAAPHVAGTFALLKQLHPDWSVEELKAELMNGSLHDVTTLPNGGGTRFGPGRTGSGREDVSLAAGGGVLAYSADDAGLVSVSFGTEVLGSLTSTKTVHLVNHGTTPQTYTLGFDVPVAAAGVGLSFPSGTSVTVPAGKTVDFPVQLSATAANMLHTMDPTVGTYQGANPRHWLTEHAGFITFSQSSTVKLRVPVYSAPVPVSNMSGAFNGGNTAVNLTGTDLCTGTIAPGPTCNASAAGFPLDVESLVTPVELQVVNTPNPQEPADENIQYAGVAFDPTFPPNGLLIFAFSTWGDWSHPNARNTYFFIDTNNDGVYEKVVFNSYSSSSYDAPLSAYANANFSSIGARYYANLLTAKDPIEGDTRLFNTNVMFLAVRPSDIGIGTPGTPIAGNIGAFKYIVETNYETVPGVHYFDTQNQGLNLGYYYLSEDLNGNSIPVTYNASNFTANGSLGALLLHHKNGSGSRAQAVLLSGATSADLSITIGLNLTHPSIGQNFTATVTVHNGGPAAASGVVAALSAPNPNFSYVSDDSGGALDPNSGVWTIGTLANGANAVLHIVLNATGSGAINVTGQVAGTTLDPVLANNTASTSTLGASSPAQADLGVTASSSAPGVSPGGSVTFTFVVTNHGPDPALNVVLTDVLTAGSPSSRVSPTVTGGSYDGAGNWSIASLAPGASETLQYGVVNHETSSQAAVTGSISAASGISDPVSANNTAMALSNNGAYTSPIPAVGPGGLLALAALLALAGAALLSRKGLIG